MSSSAVKLFIFISCFLVADRIISGVASPVKTRRMKVETPSEKVFDLDMAPNSVDDQFKGCKKKAEDKVVKTYLPQELEKNPEFKKFWEGNKGFNYYDRSIRVYTANSSVFGDLNRNMTNGRPFYRDGFNFKALHFFITRAIQKRKKFPFLCKTVYRRTKHEFNSIAKKSKIRFGLFASTSLLSNMTGFGNKTCFKIKTCYGVDISKISYFEYEKEVLIPPYEKFEVTDIKNQNNELNCEVLYILKSDGKCSNMNCEMLNKTSKKKCEKKRNRSRRAIIL